MQQLALGRNRIAPGDDLDRPVQVARAQRDEHIHRAVGQHGRKRAGTTDARSFEGGFAGCVALQAEIAGVARLADAALVLLEDHECRTTVLERLRERDADAAVAADDHVVGELIDLGMHAPDA